MSAIISVRIPKKMKEDLERLEINVAEFVKEALEKKIKEEKVKRVLKQVKKIQDNSKEIDEDLATQLVREERDRND